MVDVRSDRHLFIAGRTRSGKTVFIRSLLNRFPRVVVHDRKHEWKKWAQANHYLVIHTIDQLQFAIKKNYKRIIYAPADPSSDDFDLVCHTIFQMGNVYFVIDESQSYSPHGQIPFWFGELLRLGAGRGIGVCSIAQRPRDCNNVLISEASIIISYRLLLETDRIKISSTVGKEVQEPLRTLPKFHYMLYDSDEETIYYCAPIPYKE